MQRLDRARTTAESASDLGFAQVEPVPEDEHGALAVRQHGHDRVEFLGMKR
jgi:hypothetical protein